VIARRRQQWVMEPFFGLYTKASTIWVLNPFCHGLGCWFAVKFGLIFRISANLI
jgi:hypothetical protein